MDRENQIRKRLDMPELLPEHRKVLERWDRECEKNENIVPSTRAGQLFKIVPLALAVRKPFDKMDREDIEEFLYSLDVETCTLDQYKIYIKKFFKWLYRADTYPDVVNWIKIANHKKRMLPDDILTLVEVKALIEAADNPRDRAFVSVLYESAARIEEMVVHEKKKGNIIVPVMLKDVIFDQFGAVIILNGKTGMRRVRLIRCVPDLLVYLNNRPSKGDNEPLWITHDSLNASLSVSRAYSLIISIAKKTDIKKNIHPHLLRHTRLTEVAGFFKEADLKVFAGWTADSKMASVYIHRSGADVDRVQLEAEGIITKEEKNKNSDILKPIPCPRCKESNPSTARFCYRCGMALDMETALKIDKGESGTALELMDLMQREPRLLEMLKNITKLPEVVK
ncbi:MAG: hypothetical protein D4R88_05700 [Methanosarcinales archaeon]|nr:MAG: hypothetical protein D4R88_05700 [Methanosarcinales archaeon]